MATTSKNILSGHILPGFVEKFLRSGSASKIAQINFALFLLMWLIDVICVLSGHRRLTTEILQWSVELPSSLPLLATRPWTILTYMFSQVEPWHVIFNVLCFLWFASELTGVIGPRSIWSLYLCGGIGGALFFLLGSNLLSPAPAETQWLIGSSAAVLSVITATAVLCPHATTDLLFKGEVKLRWVALAIIALCFAGGLMDESHIATTAHVGGIVAGILYALFFLRPKRGNSRRRASTPATPTDMSQIDDIHAKIKRSGFASLTAEERRRLFEVTNRK